MFRRWFSLSALALCACDSPQLVSFDTPEPCVIDVGGFATFSAAKEHCDDDCRLCIETELDGRASSYAVSHDDTCVCPPPKRLVVPDAGHASDGSETTALVDSGTSADAAPAVSNSADAGRPMLSNIDAGTAEVSPGADGCNSHLHLTRSQAKDQCGEWDDCHVCIERIDYEGDARSYMAHQCGCPDPHRNDLQ